jgi:predicted ArsR family transcriptional regulator
MTALDAYMVDPSVDLLSKVKIQAQVLVPLIRALRAELGEAKANALVRDAMRDWSAKLFAEIGDGIEAQGRKKWAAMHNAMGEISTKEVSVEMRRKDREALEFDITSCKFAEFFRALGEPELGGLLMCATDIDIAAAGGEQVSFSRTQTIMQGAADCNFRYRFAPPAGKA